MSNVTICGMRRGHVVRGMRGQQRVPVGPESESVYVPIASAPTHSRCLETCCGKLELTADLETRDAVYTCEGLHFDHFRTIRAIGEFRSPKTSTTWNSSAAPCGGRRGGRRGLPL